MPRPLTPRALKRSQWFADITAALREAEKLLALLEADGNYPEEAHRLRQRVAIVRSELELVNRILLGEGRVLGAAWPMAALATAGDA